MTRVVDLGCWMAIPLVAMALTLTAGIQSAYAGKTSMRPGEVLEGYKADEAAQPARTIAIDGDDGDDGDDGQSYGDDEQDEQSYGDDEDDGQSYGDDEQDEQSYGDDEDDGQSYGDDEQDGQSYGDDEHDGQSYGDDEHDGQSNGDDEEDGQSYGDDEHDGQSYGDDEDDGQDFGDDEEDGQSFGPLRADKAAQKDEEPVETDEDAKMRGAIVSFAASRVGEKGVGDGECTRLVEAAMDAAGAKPGKDYVWGRKLAAGEQIAPGDIIQFTSFVYNFKGPDGSTSSGSLGRPNHTSIVEKASGTGVTLLHQNMDGSPASEKSKVRRLAINLNWKTEGSYIVYRPIRQ